MPTQMNELRDFHHFLGEKLNTTGESLSPEEALDEWRRLHPDAQAFAAEVAAIQEALDDVAAGDKGMPFEEFDREFRARHRLPSNP